MEASALERKLRTIVAKRTEAIWESLPLGSDRRSLHAGKPIVTMSIARRIRKMHKRGHAYVFIARKFGLTAEGVRMITSGRVWKEGKRAAKRRTERGVCR